MILCPKCQQPIEDDGLFCPYCMTPVIRLQNVVAVCRTCGRTLDPKTMKCPVCDDPAAGLQAPLPAGASGTDLLTRSPAPGYAAGDENPAWTQDGGYGFPWPDASAQQPKPAVNQKQKAGHKKAILLAVGIAAAVLMIGIVTTVILLMKSGDTTPPTDAELDGSQQTDLNHSLQQIEAAYQANRKLYDSVDLRLFGLSVSEENRAAAQKMLGEITDEDSFITLAYEYAAPEDKLTFENADATRLQGARYEAIRLNIAEDVADWLFDTARSTGDKHVCETDSYIFVLMIVRTAYREETPLVSARHILISYEDTANAIREQDPDAETNYTRTENTFTDNGLELTNQGTDYAIEVILESYNKARQIYDEFMAGDKTEEAFAILATLYSSDYGAEEGGLYSDIAKGQMVKPFEDWVYDGSRQPGDVGIVQTDYGWHVIYFVGSHAYPVWMEEADARLSADE